VCQRQPGPGLAADEAGQGEVRAVHRPDSGQLGGLVVDEQERCVLRRDEMVGERVAYGRAGHGSLTFS